jgi:hypothetical protein
MYIRTNNPNGTTSTARIDGRGRRSENCNIAVCIVTDNADTINDLRDDIARTTKNLRDEIGALENGSITAHVTERRAYRGGEENGIYRSISLHIVNDGLANHKVIRTDADSTANVKGIYVGHTSHRRTNDDATDAELLAQMQHGGVIWREVTRQLCTEIDQSEDYINACKDKIDTLEREMGNGTDAKYRIVTAVKDEQAAKRWIKANGYDNDNYGTVALVPTVKGY